MGCVAAFLVGWSRAKIRSYVTAVNVDLLAVRLTVVRHWLQPGVLGSLPDMPYSFLCTFTQGSGQGKSS